MLSLSLLHFLPQFTIYPGNVAVYLQFVLPAQIKTANAMFARMQNKW